MNIRITVHRLNIERYEASLMGDLTPYERRYLEQQIEQERAAMRRLFSGGSRGLNGQGTDCTLVGALADADISTRSL